MTRVFRVLLIVLITMKSLGSAASGVGSTGCPNEDDFYECTCPDDFRIDCNEIPLEEVSQIFAQATPFETPIQFSLILNLTDILIPDDLLGVDKFAWYIDLKCLSNTYKLQVSKNAFQSSKTYATDLIISNCNLELTDFSFLTSFNNLSFIGFSENVGLQYSLQSLANPLPKLNTIWAEGTSFNEIEQFPVLSSQLGVLTLINANLDDEAVSRILDWAAVSSSATMGSISFPYNHLTKFPSKASKFTAVRFISIEHNWIATLPANAVNLIAPDSVTVLLNGNGIRTIESNAFKGNFTSAKIDMSKNNLTKFESSVFEEMLTQMKPPNGLLIIDGNSLDCGDFCHLAWIAKDDWKLMEKIDGGTAYCSNGTLFQVLDPLVFSSCPITLETTTDPSLETTPDMSSETTTDMGTSMKTTTRSILTTGNDSCILGHPFDKDFTDGTLTPWIDDSNGDVAWIVEVSGNHDVGDVKNHLRLKFNKKSAFGVGILRSPKFKVGNNQTITFSYLIRSRLKQFNNLQLFWSSDSSEHLLIELYPESLPKNIKWKTISTTIPAKSSIEISLVFYGFSGTVDSDNMSTIAINNISLSQEC